MPLIEFDPRIKASALPPNERESKTHPFCGATIPQKKGGWKWTCTRKPGHKGDHIGHSFGEACARWDNENDPSKPKTTWDSDYEQ